ncbi:glycosyltransferase [Citrobacter sedlakii]|uniref:glycosyltransferase n=1 Tax=Citrobacter sedlakii TaxID=67826 RepID=UPI001901EE2D|nr:glycosyltransferase [Citrobacter sedlakii]MBJ9887666.1 glycosyltransferase [Citrobacter sedlakii]MCK8145007.1 glycosyltransferase [Citrobacter sedlakii]
MKIVLVITGLGLGGAEKQVCLLADRLTEAKHHVSIITLTGENTVLPHNENITIYNVNMKKNPLGLLLGVIKLRNIISILKPDVVHSHMFHANIMSRLSKLFGHCTYKLICTAHSKYEGGKLRMLSYRFTDYLSDINTNVSKEALREYIDKKFFSEAKSIVVYNGVDTEKFSFSIEKRLSIRKILSIDVNDKLILSVGRLNPAKDYPNLLSAFMLLPDDYKLIIIGEGEVRPKIEKIIKDHNLEARVNLLGSISNVSDYYSACDIFVLSSAWEGFSLVVIEAMSCQRIAVCTDAGGVKEAFTNSDYIVPTSDAKALANKIIEVGNLPISSINEIEKENRRKVVDDFSINSIVNHWLNVYKSNF